MVKFTLITLFFISQLGYAQHYCIVNSISDNNTTTGVGTVVNSLSGTGDIRFCMNQSTSVTGGYAIIFDNTLTGVVTLNAALPSIKNLLTISGPASGITIDGGGKFTVLSNSTGTVTAGNLTFKRGYNINDGGGIYNTGIFYLSNSTVTSCNAGRYGGGIYNNGDGFYINNCTVGNNAASGSGGGVEQQGMGLLHVTNSCFYNNVAGQYSGAIDVFGGRLYLSNSTLYGNSAGIGTLDNQSSGAIYNGGSTIILNTTIANNSATGNNLGGGIYNHGSLLVINSILAGNVANVQGYDLFSEATATILGYNNIISSTVNGLNNDLNGNIINVSITGVLFSNSLVYNGGPTPVIPLAIGSPAVGAGINTFTGIVISGVDQKGLARVDVFDIGAVEFQPVVQNISGLPIVANRAFGNPVITISGVKGGDSGNPLELNIYTSPSSGIASIVGYTTSVSGVVTYTGCLISLTGIGTVTLTGIQDGNLFYAPGYVVRTFNIDKGSQYIKTISAVPDSVMYGKVIAVNMFGTASTGLDISFSIATTPVTGVASLNGNVISVIGTGVVTITASQIGNDYYYPAPGYAQSFSIVKGTQTITGLSSIPNVTFGDVATITIFANTSSKLPASFSLITDPASGVAEISGNIISITGPGTVTVTASQIGNNNYWAADDMTRTFSVQGSATAILQSEVQKNSVVIYPNPNNGNFTVELESTPGVSAYPIYVLNILGSEVRKIVPEIQRQQYEVIGLTPGIYVIKTGVVTQKIWVE